MVQYEKIYFANIFFYSTILSTTKN